MSFALWSLFVGVLLITMVLAGTLLDSLHLSSAMIYLGLGYVLGPGGFLVVEPNPFLYAGTLELITEVAVLISLFAVGLKLGIPLLDRRWILPLRLAFPSMVITVGLIAAIGVWGLNLSLGAAVLLGGILAPTDPVLASGVQSDPGTSPDRVRFSLAGEGALNNASAFPFVLLGLGLMGLHDVGVGGWRWWLIDLLWSTLGGLVIGAALGALIGKLVVYLRTRYQNAVGLDEFLSLGLIAISYGTAQAGALAPTRDDCLVRYSWYRFGVLPDVCALPRRVRAIGRATCLADTVDGRRLNHRSRRIGVAADGLVRQGGNEKSGPAS